MHVYNSIIILQELSPVFPVASVNDHAGPALAITIERFLEKEDRADLKVIGSAFASNFNKRKSMWSSPERAIKVFTQVPALYLVLSLTVLHSHLLRCPLRSQRRLLRQHLPSGRVPVLPPL